MKLHEEIFQRFGAVVGFILISIYTLWWIATGIAVISIVFGLLKTSLFGWASVEGWRKYYMICGAMTVALISFKIVPYVIKEGFRLLFSNPISLIVGIVAAGCIPIIAIPIITVGWPIVVFYSIQSYWDKSRSNSE